MPPHRRKRLSNETDLIVKNYDSQIENPENSSQLSPGCGDDEKEESLLNHINSNKIGLNNSNSNSGCSNSSSQNNGGCNSVYNSHNASIKNSRSNSPYNTNNFQGLHTPEFSHTHHRISVEDMERIIRGQTPNAKEYAIVDVRQGQRRTGGYVRGAVLLTFSELLLRRMIKRKALKDLVPVELRDRQFQIIILYDDKSNAGNLSRNLLYFLQIIRAQHRSAHVVFVEGGFAAIQKEAKHLIESPVDALGDSPKIHTPSTGDNQTQIKCKKSLKRPMPPPLTLKRRLSEKSFDESTEVECCKISIENNNDSTKNNSSDSSVYDNKEKEEIYDTNERDDSSSGYFTNRSSSFSSINSSHEQKKILLQIPQSLTAMTRSKSAGSFPQLISIWPDHQNKNENTQAGSCNNSDGNSNSIDSKYENNNCSSNSINALDNQSLTRFLSTSNLHRQEVNNDTTSTATTNTNRGYYHKRLASASAGFSVCTSPILSCSSSSSSSLQMSNLSTAPSSVASSLNNSPARTPMDCAQASCFAFGSAQPQAEACSSIPSNEQNCKVPSTFVFSNAISNEDKGDTTDCFLGNTKDTSSASSPPSSPPCLAVISTYSEIDLGVPALDIALLSSSGPSFSVDGTTKESGREGDAHGRKTRSYRVNSSSQGCHRHVHRGQDHNSADDSTSTALEIPSTNTCRKNHTNKARHFVASCGQCGASFSTSSSSSLLSATLASSGCHCTTNSAWNLSATTLSPMPSSSSSSSLSSHCSSAAFSSTALTAGHQTTVMGYSASVILPYLILGSERDAGDGVLMQQLKVTHVLSLTPEGVSQWARQHCECKHISLLDNCEQDILDILPSCVEFIEKARCENGRCLVYCFAGVSRSASVVTGYLMAMQQLSYEEALDYVRSRRSIVAPNLGFLSQLMAWDRLCCSAGNSPVSASDESSSRDSGSAGGGSKRVSRRGSSESVEDAVGVHAGSESVASLLEGDEFTAAAAADPVTAMDEQLQQLTTPFLAQSQPRKSKKNKHTHLNPNGLSSRPCKGSHSKHRSAQSHCPYSAPPVLLHGSAFNQQTGASASSIFSANANTCTSDMAGSSSDGNNSNSNRMGSEAPSFFTFTVETSCFDSERKTKFENNAAAKNGLPINKDCRYDSCVATEKSQRINMHQKNMFDNWNDINIFNDMSNNHCNKQSTLGGSTNAASKHSLLQQFATGSAIKKQDHSSRYRRLSADCVFIRTHFNNYSSKVADKTVNKNIAVNTDGNKAAVNSTLEVDFTSSGGDGSSASSLHSSGSAFVFDFVSLTDNDNSNNNNNSIFVCPSPKVH